MSAPTVIVVGAGPAGLAAAQRLRQAGVAVRVLEKGDRAGSKMSSVRRDGFLLDTGAIFLPTSYVQLLALVSDLGAGGEVVPGGFVFGLADADTIHELDGERLVRAFARTRALSTRDKLRLSRLGPELLRSATARPDRVVEAGRFDGESVASWSSRQFPPALHEQVINAITRGIFAADARALSRVELLGILNLFRGARLVALRGGMGHLAEVLASGLEIELGCEVLAVQQTRDGASVAWRDADGEHTEEVGGCVIAVPGQAAAGLRADLDPWRAAYLTAIRQGRVTTPNIALDRPPAGLGATYTLVPRARSRHIGGFGCDHLKAPGRAPAGRGLITLTPMTEWCERHAEDDDETIAELAVRSLDGLLPGSADQVEFVQVTRWRQQYAPVGHYRDIGSFAARTAASDRTVQFAGEHLAAPNLNAAVASGERAARSLLDAASLRSVA